MDRIFFKSDIVDAYSGLPIYVFDTSYLPSPDIIDYDQFIPTLMSILPESKYILVMFSCGLNKISWLYGVKFLKSFLSPGDGNLDNLHKIIAVHESWFVKSISQILTNFSLSKRHVNKLNVLLDITSYRLGLLISCGSISDLSNYVDVQKLKISLNVYKHDAEITMSPRIELLCPSRSIISSSTTLSPHCSLFYHHFYQIFQIVDNYGTRAEALFLRPGNRLNTEILFYCILRNQFIWINDWDLHCIASCFKRLLKEVPNPLFAVDDITLPMNDDLNYTLVVFNKIMAIDYDNSQVLFQLLHLCHRMIENSHVTKHNAVSLAKSFASVITHENKLKQNSDRNSIAIRFIKNVLNHWDRIYPLYGKRFASISDIVNGKSINNQEIDELYNLSHEITIDDDDDDSGDEESQRVQVNTKSILDNDNALAHPLAKPVPPSPRKTTIPSGEVSNVSGGNYSHNRKLSDVSNILKQWPPQKYKFERKESSTSLRKPQIQQPPPPVKRQVVRGRKVGELTKLFEERSQAIELLETMNR